MDHGASVINISQGGSLAPFSNEERQAIGYALEHKVVIVSASGNEGESGTEAIGYPASYPGVVDVGAVKKSNEIWDKSNAGPNLLLTAPGPRVVSTGTDSYGYRMGSGTSDSAAYVSAACALLREKFPDLTAGQIVNRLTKTAGLPASAKGLKLPDEKYGYGYIRPLAALEENIPAAPRTARSPVPASGSARLRSSASGDSGSGLTTKSVIALGTLAALGVLIVIGVPLLLVRRARRRRAGGAEPVDPARRIRKPVSIDGARKAVSSMETPQDVPLSPVKNGGVLGQIGGPVQQGRRVAVRARDRRDAPGVAGPGPPRLGVHTVADLEAIGPVHRRRSPPHGPGPVSKSTSSSTCGRTAFLGSRSTGGS